MTKTKPIRVYWLEQRVPICVVSCEIIKETTKTYRLNPDTRVGGYYAPTTISKDNATPDFNIIRQKALGRLDVQSENLANTLGKVEADRRRWASLTESDFLENNR